MSNHLPTAQIAQNIDNLTANDFNSIEDYKKHQNQLNKKQFVSEMMNCINNTKDKNANVSRDIPNISMAESLINAMKDFGQEIDLNEKEKKILEVVYGKDWKKLIDISSSMS